MPNLFGLLLLLPLISQGPNYPPPLHVVHFGTCALENGETLEDCEIGYRWYGEPNADGSNVIILPHWFTGHSKDQAMVIGKILPTEGVAYLAFDGFGNGTASSPSNSPRQRGTAFPAFSMRDMVRWEHTAAVETLGLRHVKAVVGISMGGMQALQWAVSYPDYMDKVVNVVGTPKPDEADIRPWRWQIASYKAGARVGIQRGANVAATLNAMAHHDIGAGRPLADAARMMRAELLTVVNKQDNLLRPQSSLALAELVHGRVLMFDEACGHLSPAVCQRGATGIVISEFLLH